MKNSNTQKFKGNEIFFYCTILLVFKKSKEHKHIVQFVWIEGIFLSFPHFIELEWMKRTNIEKRDCKNIKKTHIPFYWKHGRSISMKMKLIDIEIEEISKL